VELPEPVGVPARGRPKGAVRRLLRTNRDFRLLFFGQVVSFTGDWFLFVALAGLVFDLTHSAALVTAVYAAWTVPFAVFSFVGGPLADRLNRQFLMISADVLRGMLALGFFLIHRPSQVWLVYVLAGLITALGAVFDPASQASIPNLVDREDLATANVLAGATWGTMLAVGAAIGGLVVAAFGRGAGYIGDAASFFVSASLIVQIRRPFSEAREEGHEHPGFAEATREAVGYARHDHRVLALITVKGGVGLGAGIVALLPILALEVYHAGDRGTGILYAFRGAGVVIGPFLARRLIKEGDLPSLFRAISLSLAVYGLSYGVVGWMPGIYLAGVFVMLGHFGGGSMWMLSSYGLQLLVPDAIRGRIFAFDQGMITFTVAVSALTAGAVATVVSVKLVMVGLAAIIVAFAIVWTVATRNVRRSPGPATAPVAEA
jgi:predicted MFS family arabinose efflux permease